MKRIRWDINLINNWIQENESEYKCISKTYVKAIDNLKFMCDKGHTFEMSWSHFYNGERCQYCSGKHRYTFNEVKQIIESEQGYKLLSNEYKNCKENLQIQCNNGHVFDMSFDEFNNGNHRCSICNTGANFKYDLNIAKQIFKNGNCELLATEYINCDTPMKYRCECGNVEKMSLKMFQSGQRCYKCRNKKIGNILRTPFKDVQKIFADANCILLSIESDYVNDRSELDYICSCGNQDTITLNKFKAGERCNKCKSDRSKQTCIERFGVDTPLKSPEIREKVRKSLYENGTAPCSRQQKYLHNLYSGELNYPIKTLSLDIAFPDDKFYIEYDGGLHRGTVIYGNVTDEEFDKKERNRTYGLMRSGWKEMRIISSKDSLPYDSILLDMLSYSKSYLQNHHYIKFDIDNSKLINSQGNFDYDYGELRQIKNTDLQEAS